MKYSTIAIALILINLLAIIIWFIIYKSLRSVRSANQSVHVDSATEIRFELHKR